MIQDNINNFRNFILNIKEADFTGLALSIFQYQYKCNSVYQKYVKLLGVSVDKVKDIQQIPFLPVSLFKSHEVKTGLWPVQKVYSSSGTTGDISSKHLIRDETFYLNNTQVGFEFFYGDVSQYLIIALLPSYLERQGSSLISMMEFFISKAQPGSGFYLNEYSTIIRLIETAKTQQKPVLLLGVSFALLDFAEKFKTDFKNVIVMETGGMKGKRRELIREELHDVLKSGFNIASVHAEYGMTELFSQAYSKDGGIFYPSPAMRVLTRPINDPLGIEKPGKTGILNIIDLANIDTCCFIATDDLGIVFEDKSFTVSGRMDHSDIRGCNLMVENL